MSVYFERDGGALHLGDCREVLAGLEPDSVQCCVTSPPYWGLRDYGAEGQLGLEETLEEYLAGMVEAFESVRRVLRPDGTLWLNLGDCYAGSFGTQGKSGQMAHRSVILARQVKAGPKVAPRKNSGLKPKDLVGLPWRVAFALQAAGWWLRADIIWHKPAPMPESVKDRPTRAHEFMFLLAKTSDYYYDADAIRERATGAHPRGDGVNQKALVASGPGRQNESWSRAMSGTSGEWRNRRSVWTVPPEPSCEEHFAAYPQKLVVPCILAGSRPGDLVLDPFSGTATTGVVALRHGRRFIGCDVSRDYLEISRRRIERETAQAQLFSGHTEPATAAEAPHG